MGTDGQVVLDRAASETKKLCASRREIHRAPSGLWPPGALALLAPDLTFLARNLAHAAKSGDVGVNLKPRSHTFASFASPIFKKQ
jgi:hypothetical protein